MSCKPKKFIVRNKAKQGKTTSEQGKKEQTNIKAKQNVNMAKQSNIKKVKQGHLLMKKSPFLFSFLSLALIVDVDRCVQHAVATLFQ